MIIRLKAREHYRFYILLIVLITLLFFRYALQISIPRSILTAMIAITALYGNRDEIFAITMCCIPLHESVDVYYSIVICAVIYILKNPKKIRIDSSVIFILFAIIWELLHCFNSNFSVMKFLISMIPLIYLIVVLCVDVSDLDYGFIIRTMSIIVTVICIILLVNCIVMADFDLSKAFSNLRRLGLISKENAIIGGTINPNSLGILSVLSITSLQQLRVTKKNKKGDIALVLTLLIFGTLTSSRTFLVCLIMMTLLLILGQKGNFYEKIRFLVSLVVFALVALFLLNWLFPDLMSYYVGRFHVEDITTGRDQLMYEYHQFISNNLEVMFFGIGLTDFRTELIEIYRVSNNVPHNSIQEIIVAWGLPGIIMFGVFFAMVIMKARRYNSKPILLNYIPLLLILAKSMAGQLLTSGYTMLALSFAYLSLCQNFSQNELQYGEPYN